MGLSNMLSKLFKKDNADVSVQIPVKFKDFDSIIVPPEPTTRPIFIYRTLDLNTDFEATKSPDAGRGEAPLPDEVNAADTITEEE